MKELNGLSHTTELVNEFGIGIDGAEVAEIAEKASNITFDEIKEGITIEGYCIRYGITDRENELVQDKAFRLHKDYKSSFVPVLINHSPSACIGVAKVTFNDDKGVKYKCEIKKGKTPMQDLFIKEYLKGNVKGNSAGFIKYLDRTQEYGSTRIINKGLFFEMSFLINMSPVNPEAGFEEKDVTIKGTDAQPTEPPKEEIKTADDFAAFLQSH